MFLGGKGLGTAYLLKELSPGIDPLGPDNKLIITAGPLTGTIAPSSSRFEIITKSPLTGIYLSCNSGGHFGPELKAAGFDLMIIEGHSDSPVVLFVRNDRVDFLDAEAQWGLNTYETEKSVRKLVGDPEARVLSIGPAGENLVRYACLSNDFSRNAARGGIGAVLGSKMVKALAVRGTKDIPVADFKALKKVSAKAKGVIFNNPWVEGQRKYGTARSVAVVNANGFLPVENFTRGSLDEAEGLYENVWEKKIGKVLSCGQCPVACAKGYRKKDIVMEGPEYETIGLFGPNLGILDPDEIAYFNYLCNQYGLDTITTGTLLGGLIDTEIFKETGKPRKEIIAELLENITFRRGAGKILAEGMIKAGEAFGCLERMPQVKGMGFPAYDPRISYGTALVYMTADRGACHLCSWPVGRELGGLWPEDDIDSRIEFVKNQQEEKAAEESLTVCQFVYGIGLLDPVLAEMVNVSCGENWTMESLKLAGERCWTLSRMFNCREGISRKDDYLPLRFAEEPIVSGPKEGNTVPVDIQNYMLDKYYQLRGWDNNGIPSEELIRRLGLEEWNS